MGIGKMMSKILHNCSINSYASFWKASHSLPSFFKAREWTENTGLLNTKLDTIPLKKPPVKEDNYQSQWVYI